MGKKLLGHLANGFALTVLIVLIIQVCLMQAGVRVVTPGFAAHFRSEAAAAMVQLGLIGLIGMAFAGAALIFEIPRWSYLKQGAVHFLVTAAVWLPVALICWTPAPAGAVAIAAAGWTLTYAINWGIQYLIFRRSVRALNRRIEARRREEEEHK